ncbi:hypothetical protein E8E13_000800 [Curvularia kusanoi]|uniref:Uncharacterized protein n=1 Tax=Curvularia kusanoi TaxID=90978 RepID=A0A9P4T720_CURKU|nr:hypothetical protein E8E13_000800 [Curvularia kusanoi]
MSEGTTQEAILAVSPDDIAQSSGNDNPSLNTASVFPFAKLPKDIRRIIYDYLPEPTFRPLLKSEQGRSVHFETLRIPQALLQANKFFREEMLACLETVTIDKPVTVVLHENEKGRPRLQPHEFLECAYMVLNLLRNGRSYDNLNQSKGEGLSSANFDKWTLKRSFFATL